MDRVWCLVRMRMVNIEVCSQRRPAHLLGINVHTSIHVHTIWMFNVHTNKHDNFRFEPFSH